MAALCISPRVGLTCDFKAFKGPCPALPSLPIVLTLAFGHQSQARRILPMEEPLSLCERLQQHVFGPCQVPFQATCRAGERRPGVLKATKLLRTRAKSPGWRPPSQDPTLRAAPSRLQGVGSARASLAPKAPRPPRPCSQLLLCHSSCSSLRFLRISSHMYQDHNVDICKNIYNICISEY